VVLLLHWAKRTRFLLAPGWEARPSFGAVAFSPDGAPWGSFTVIVASGISQPEIFFWHHNISGEVTSVDYNPDGRWLAASG
jgi:WD40 repeat protein